MKILDRSAITITSKTPFIEWNNNLFPDLPMEENVLGESRTYLINELFDTTDSIIKKNYKIIFEMELEVICTDEDEWPKKRNFKLFNEWFSHEISNWVIDLL